MKKSSQVQQAWQPPVHPYRLLGRFAPHTHTAPQPSPSPPTAVPQMCILLFSSTSRQCLLLVPVELCLVRVCVSHQFWWPFCEQKSVLTSSLPTPAAIFAWPCEVEQQHRARLLFQQPARCFAHHRAVALQLAVGEKQQQALSQLLG